MASTSDWSKNFNSRAGYILPLLPKPKADSGVEEENEENLENENVLLQAASKFLNVYVEDAEDASQAPEVSKDETMMDWSIAVFITSTANLKPAYFAKYPTGYILHISSKNESKFFKLQN
ncbi:uncharacterized protein LOC130894282 [Diorhabda carinulata]|uniref:uncharacterized protein LOC130894282 n=1 Tax=Diorhabda carinulata TaxID=1163345 RepID=UPI0025A1421A|nr:uncharacterized protein LOC130894282 [Diorhabda carinulata]